jgi:hypothetical protein
MNDFLITPWPLWAQLLAIPVVFVISGIIAGFFLRHDLRAKQNKVDGLIRLHDGAPVVRLASLTIGGFSSHREADRFIRNHGIDQLLQLASHIKRRGGQYVIETFDSAAQHYRRTEGFPSARAALNFLLDGPVRAPTDDTTSRAFRRANLGPAVAAAQALASIDKDAPSVREKRIHGH